MSSNTINYSEKYSDDQFEYRHVTLPKDIAKCAPKDRLLTEDECRKLGITQSRGWIHYMIHAPEPHVLLFRRPLTANTQDANEAEEEDENN